MCARDLRITIFLLSLCRLHAPSRDVVLHSGDTDTPCVGNTPVAGRSGVLFVYGCLSPVVFAQE